MFEPNIMNKIRLVRSADKFFSDSIKEKVLEKQRLRADWNRVLNVVADWSMTIEMATGQIIRNQIV